MKWANRQSFAVLAAFILLIPFFGPLLDHHFAERQFGHAHVYLGQVTLDHVHPYERPHTHGKSQDRAGDAAGHLSLDDAPDDIVYLTPYDAAVQVFALLALHLHQTQLVIPDHGDDATLHSFAPEDHPPTEAFIAPARKPPRT